MHIMSKKSAQPRASKDEPGSARGILSLAQSYTGGGILGALHPHLTRTPSEIIAAQMPFACEAMGVDPNAADAKDQVFAALLVLCAETWPKKFSDPATRAKPGKKASE